MNRDETGAEAHQNNCDELVLQNGGTDSAGNIAPLTLFPDKTNLRNGDLKRELISCSSYFVNFRDTAEMKEVLKFILYIERWDSFLRVKEQSGNAIKRMHIRMQQVVLRNIPPMPKVFVFHQIAKTFSILALLQQKKRIRWECCVRFVREV